MRRACGQQTTRLSGPPRRARGLSWRATACGVGVAAVCLVAALSATQEEILTNEAILKLSQAGLPPEVILAKIMSTGSAFDTSAAQMVFLAEAGVHTDVLATMFEVTPLAAPAVEPPDERSVAGAAPEPVAGSEPVARTSWLPGATFFDRLASGGRGPEMVVIPAGRFYMGCVSGMGCSDRERPIRDIAFSRMLAVAKYEVTFDDYDRFTQATGRPPVEDGGWGRGRRPAVNVSWSDALDYAAWLSREAEADYRLLSEAEWEYTTRAGTMAQYHFGDSAIDLCGYGNHADATLPEHVAWRNRSCSDGVGSETAEVGRYRPNPWGLHDTHGNVWEWVEDCWNENYTNAPPGGEPWLAGDCARRVARGGSWGNQAAHLRAANRAGLPADERAVNVGFRVARTLLP